MSSMNDTTGLVGRLIWSLYGPGVRVEDEAALSRLDDALIRLRRLWQIPAGRHRTQPDGAVVPELSTVLVVEAIGHRQQNSTGGVGIADVAARLSVAPSTASRLVDRAVRSGVVERNADHADPRRAALTLTGAGTTLLERSFEFRRGYLGQVLSGWNHRDVRTLATLLDRFADDVLSRGFPTEKTP